MLMSPLCGQVGGRRGSVGAYALGDGDASPRGPQPAGHFLPLDQYALNPVQRVHPVLAKKTIPVDDYFHVPGRFRDQVYVQGAGVGRVGEPLHSLHRYVPAVGPYVNLRGGTLRTTQVCEIYSDLASQTFLNSWRHVFYI